ncbi:hypothetical protein GEV33_001416 [Tenebrio molitor]|uniref:Uncharacterized protein n=1 Tax=Tenebrio molitor TaxID=7067 RepID=A0A8J6LGU7_TENMO|nr:hypothetical protein GEV33_001416 [Tenebrio molitor]
MMMFKIMIESILMYRAEIWGWKEQEKVERVQEKYLRGVLGVDRETPESDKVRRQNGWKGRVQDTNGMLERKEKKHREEGGRNATRERGEEVERLRTKGRWMNVELSAWDKGTDKQERRERIKESRYNREYERCMTEEIPKYLGSESARERCDLDVGTRREKTGTGRKKRKEGEECFIRRKRQLSTCGMDVAK